MSGALTAWPDPHVDAAIRRMLDPIVAAVRGQMGNDLLAMLLTGGFGRGEGSVRVAPDGSVRVVNDFDIELVYPERWGALADKLVVQWRHRRALGELAERLARELRMKQVDLTLRPLSSLRSGAPCRLADFDLQHGHRLLWGVRDPCLGMPELRPADIDPFEGTWLLRNRGIGLMLARLYLDQPGGLAVAQQENFGIELQKAWLAMGDALWILSGHYQVSYAYRAQEAALLDGLHCPQWPGLRAHYQAAVQRKLRPTAEVEPVVEPQAHWQEAAAALVGLFTWFESRRLAQDIDSVADWIGWSERQPRPSGGHALRRWIDRRLGTVGDCPPAMVALRTDRLASVGCALALLAVRVDGRDALWQPLQRWGLGRDWNALARGLLAALHPGGEVGRFLKDTAR